MLRMERQQTEAKFPYSTTKQINKFWSRGYTSGCAGEVGEHLVSSEGIHMVTMTGSTSWYQDVRSRQPLGKGRIQVVSR